MLVGHTFNVITHNRGLNLLSTAKEKKIWKSIIQHQEELIQLPRADFGWVFKSQVY